VCDYSIIHRTTGALTGEGVQHLLAETVESAARALQGVDDIESSDGLPLGVLAVGDGVADNVLEEDLENTTGLLVDKARDTLDTTTTSETANRGLGDTLDVVAQDLAMTLRAALAETLAAFAASRHVYLGVVWVGVERGRWWLWS